MLPKTKPPLGAQLNRKHPLCPDLLCVLMNEGSGSQLTDIACGRTGAINLVNTTWVPNQAGLGLRTAGDIQVATFTGDAWLKMPITFVIGYYKSVGGQCSAFSDSVQGGGNRINALVPYNDGTVYWDGGDASGGRVTYGGGTFAPNDIWVFNSGPRGSEIWQNGLLRASSGSSGSYSPIGSNFLIGGPSANDTTHYDFIYAYSTQLSADAIRAISAQPFAFIQSRPIYHFVSTAIDGTGSIIAPAATIAATGSLEVTATATIIAPHATFAGTGDIGAAGAAAITAPHTLISGSGSVEVTGTASIIAPHTTIAATGPGLSTSGGLRCLIAGKNRWLLVGTTSFQFRMNTRGSGNTQIFGPPTGSPWITPVRPLVGQEIKFIDADNARVEFVGQIDRVDETIYAGTAANPAYNWAISFSDLSAIFDRRIVSTSYPAGGTSPQTGTASDIIVDAATQFLVGDNITTTNVTSVASASAVQPFNNVTFMEFMTRLCEITGDLFFVDSDGDLNCYAPGAGGDAPFEITDFGDNYRDLKLTNTLVGFTNTAFVRSDNNLGTEAPIV